MSKLTDRIREYVRCPQIDGGTEYGEWGALRIDQRRLIRELCEHCERQEEFADTFFKETQALKHQLADKDEELAELKDRLEYITGNRNGVVQVFDITDHDKEIRHQVCEEIREKLKREYTRAENKYWLSMEKVCFVTGYDIFDEFEWEKILDQIEQGESKC